MAALATHAGVGDPPRIAWAYPLVPLAVGDAAVDLGFDVEGQPRQLAVTIRGDSGTGGTFVSLANAVIDRDQAGAVPFHVRIPLAAAFPPDGKLVITAAPISADGTRSPAQTFTFDASAPPPAFADPPVSVQPDTSGNIVVQVGYEGAVATGEVSLLGVSAQALRAANGNLREAEPAAFAVERGLVARPRESAPGKISFVVPRNGRLIPFDGVVIADVALRDPFGRTIHSSAVEFTNSEAFDRILSVEARPSSLVIPAAYGAREQLRVSGYFARGGETDLTGAGKGVTYAVQAGDGVVAVTSSGEVLALKRGEADVRVSYGDASTLVHVIVASDTTLDRITLTPSGPSSTIGRVGGSLDLIVTGTVKLPEDPACVAAGCTFVERTVDLTDGATGTVYLSGDPGIAVVSPNGRVTSKRPGTVTVTATHSALSASIVVDAADGDPEVTLIAPASVVAGTTFEVKAVASDDVGVAKVEFLLNTVPAAESAVPPHSIRLTAPPYAGSVMRLGARVTDTYGHHVVSTTVEVKVTDPRAPWSNGPVWKAPAAGAMLIQGVPQVLRVASDRGFPSVDDYQVVRFSVDDRPIGQALAPRVEMQEVSIPGRTPYTVATPLWETTYVPPLGSSGTSASIRAEAVDRLGNTVHSQTLLVRIVSDAPPLITVNKPVGPNVDATVAAPLVFEGTIGDDALAFGLDAALLVDGASVASARLTAPGINGSPTGSQPFSLAWTPPGSLLGRRVKVEVQAIDSGHNERRVAFDVLIRSDQPPQVAVLSPVSETTVPMGAEITLTARVLDDSPPPVQVTWMVDGTAVGASSSAPYSVAYRVPVLAQSATLVIEAVARDSAGNEGRSSAKLNASTDATPPSASIVTPKNTADVPTSQNLLITAAGLDDVGVVRVEILFDDQVVFEDKSPAQNAGEKGSFLVHHVIDALNLAGGGDHRISARAYDASGNVGRAPEVLIHTHADKPPTVSIVSPLAAAQVTTGTTVDVLVEASDDVAVSRVELFDGAVPVGTVDLVPPYRFTYAAAGAPRTVKLRAVATDCAEPPQTSTHEIDVQIVKDSQPPAVAFRSPNDGDRVFAGRTLEVEVAASDNVRVTSVDLRVDGLSQGAPYRRDTGSPYDVFRWRVPVPASAADHPLSLRAIATDSASLTAERTLVLHPVADAPPQVTLLAPPAGASYREGEDVKVAYTLADDDGVIGVVGLSGDVRQGSLPTTGAPLDTSGEKVLVVWAPIVSQGQPPTIGIVARDTMGQDGQATVSLSMELDTEAPSAVLTAPVPDPNGPIQVKAGGSLGVSVDVGDDVRVKRVAVLVDGIEIALPDGKEVLVPRNERFDETRTPNPLGPGDILVSRRYLATFQGTAPLKSIPAGRHKLSTRAYDPAGNATSTTSVDFEIIPFTDREAPLITLKIWGAPDDAHLVAGSKLDLDVSASDDGLIQRLTVELDGVEILSEPVEPPRGNLWKRLVLQIPALPLLTGSRPIVLVATATDAAGHVGTTTLTRELVQDQPPMLEILEPMAGATLTEEQPEWARVTFADDVGVVSGLILVSTIKDDLRPEEDGLSVADPMALGSTVSGVRLDYYLNQRFEVSAAAGRVAIADRRRQNIFGESPGLLRLAIDGPANGSAVSAQVTYRYRVRAGTESHPHTKAFLTANPGGRRSVTLQAPAYAADLGFPYDVLDVESVTIVFDGTAASDVQEVSLSYRDASGEALPQGRARAAGELFALERVNTGRPAPGTQKVSQHFRVPAGWAPRSIWLSASGVDTAGVPGLITDTDSHSTQPDQVAPKVALSILPPYGETVVENAPFTVHVQHTDNVTVQHLDLLADGAVRASYDPFLGSRSSDVVMTIPAASATPVALTCIAQDRAGNATLTDPLYVTVVPDAAPTVRFVSAYSSVENVSQTELQTGYVRLLQAVRAYIGLTVHDDVGISSIAVEYEGTEILNQTFTYPVRDYNPYVSVQPPVRADGTPTVLEVIVHDGVGHETRARLIIETRQPSSPALAIAAPLVDQTIAEGSIALYFQVVAGDDTKVQYIELYVNGRWATRLVYGTPIGVYTDHLGDDGMPVAFDPAVRAAVKSLAPPWNDATRLLAYGATIDLPPGFVALGLGSLSLRAVATDLEGNQSIVDRTIQVVADETPPAVEILRPTLGRDVIEGTPVVVQVAAHDNVLVKEVEIRAGSSQTNLAVKRVVGGFPAKNAVPGSAYDVYAPLVSYDLPVPTYAELGISDPTYRDPIPYFVAAVARDISGNESLLTVRQIEIVRDRWPAATIISPSPYARAVEGTRIPVLVAAEDDVGIGSVQLNVDGTPLPIALHAPQFWFQVPVPPATPGRMLELEAVVIDTYGHEVHSEKLSLPVVADAAPTVAIAQPRGTDKPTEGRDLAFLVAAQDDSAVSRVEATVEGGVSGPLRFVATAAPYAFKVPLPYGSAGRTLTFRARAWDDLKPTPHETQAAPMSVTVVSDTKPPTVIFRSPANLSQIVEGLKLDLEVEADDNVAVASVVFELDGQVLATMPAPPFRTSYRVPRGSVGHTLQFVARAADTSALTATATANVEIIADKPPAVTLVPPPKVVVGLPAVIQAQASDDVAVAQVAFHAGIDPVAPPQIDQRFILPYEVSWIPDKSLEGKEVTLRARALDLAGQETWSAPARVTVEPDAKPTIEIRKPASGSLVFDGAPVRIQAEAFDADGGVVRVEFFVDGRRVDTALQPAGIPGAPSIWAGTFYAPVGSGNRTFTITAVATDTAGQETISRPVVIGTVQDTVPPEVVLVDPADLDVVTAGELVHLSAAAVDNASIEKVEFFVQGLTIGSTSVSKPGPSSRPLWSFDWLADTGKDGTTQVIRAEASDPAHNVGVSQAVSVELGMRPKELWPNPPRGGGDASPPLGAFAVRGDGLALLGVEFPQDPPRKGATLELAQVREAAGGATDPVFDPLAVIPIDGATVGGVFQREGQLALVTVRTSELDSRVGAPALVVLDVSNRMVPKRLGAIDLSGPDVYRVATRDRLAFVANGEAGVVVVDLAVPAMPVRIATVPTVGPALDVAVSGDRLLVAAGPAGLRVLDLRDPELSELGFAAVPGGAVAVAAQGDRAYVGCEGGGAQVAVVDVSRPTEPAVRALVSHAPERRDLRTTGIVDVDIAGEILLATARLVDQDALPVKGMLTASAVKPDATVSRLVRANLPAAGYVAHAWGGALALHGDAGVAAFTLPRMVVTDVAPPDGADQVAADTSVAVELTIPPDPLTVVTSCAAPTETCTVQLRAQDPAIGPLVEVTARIEGRRLLLSLPAGKTLDLATTYFLVLEVKRDKDGNVLAAVASESGLPLAERYVSRFRTRAAADPLPVLQDVTPGSGTVEGGTPVTLSGYGFREGARVFLLGWGGHRRPGRRRRNDHQRTDPSERRGARPRDGREPERPPGVAPGRVRVPRRAGGELRLARDRRHDRSRSRRHLGSWDPARCGGAVRPRAGFGVQAALARKDPVLHAGEPVRPRGRGHRESRRAPRGGAGRFPLLAAGRHLRARPVPAREGPAGEPPAAADAAGARRREGRPRIPAVRRAGPDERVVRGGRAVPQHPGRALGHRRLRPGEREDRARRVVPPAVRTGGPGRARERRLRRRERRGSPVRRHGGGGRTVAPCRRPDGSRQAAGLGRPFPRHGAGRRGRGRPARGGGRAEGARAVLARGSAEAGSARLRRSLRRRRRSTDAGRPARRRLGTVRARDERHVRERRRRRARVQATDGRGGRPRGPGGPGGRQVLRCVARRRPRRPEGARREHLVPDRGRRRCGSPRLSLRAPRDGLGRRQREVRRGGARGAVRRGRERRLAPARRVPPDRGGDGSGGAQAGGRHRSVPGGEDLRRRHGSGRDRGQHHEEHEERQRVGLRRPGRDRDPVPHGPGEHAGGRCLRRGGLDADPAPLHPRSPRRRRLHGPARADGRIGERPRRRRHGDDERDARDARPRSAARDRHAVPDRRGRPARRRERADPDACRVRRGVHDRGHRHVGARDARLRRAAARSERGRNARDPDRHGVRAPRRGPVQRPARDRRHGLRRRDLRVPADAGERGRRRDHRDREPLQDGNPARRRVPVRGSSVGEGDNACARPVVRGHARRHRRHGLLSGGPGAGHVRRRPGHDGARPRHRADRGRDAERRARRAGGRHGSQPRRHAGDARARLHL